ncbi:uncharacterized protein OCT59_012318 [Rhizophagus irregularis]|uniref:uncharacterized protein n=1 Tax=Rhizophagus irregularis TaxID=588596 RepID=UPI00332A242F|nr:hypothetical protein OCT59_012318 [Rhizophagus irregularis]
MRYNKGISIFLSQVKKAKWITEYVSRFLNELKTHWKLNYLQTWDLVLVEILIYQDFGLSGLSNKTKIRQ